MNPQLLLQAIDAISQKYTLLNQKTGGHFNIFDIVHASTDEVRICRVLYELLSPIGTHGQKYTYLELFTDRVLGLHLSASELETARVYREFPIDNNRRIDLVIETSERFIPIEVKIYASDQPGQCYDYYREAQKHMSAPTLYYLTRFGVEPSCDSTSGLTKSDDKCEKIKTISFAVDIIDWLNLCAKETNTLKITPIREIILQLIAVIRQFTEQMEVDVEMEVKELLLNSSENMRSAVAIQNSLAQAKETFIENLFAAIDAKVEMERLINEYDYAFDHYKSIRTFYKANPKGNSMYPGISYLYKSNVKNGVDSWVRMALDSFGVYVGYCCPTNQKEKGQPLSEEEIQSLLGVSPEIDGWWAYWEYCPNNRENDCPNFTNMNDSYFLLLDKQNFNEFVDSCVERILFLLNH